MQLEFSKKKRNIAGLAPRPAQQHLQRLGLLDGNGDESTKGAKGAFPGGGQWQ
jgi:hypothetical protein